MRIVKPGFKIERLELLDGDAILRRLEEAGRICYRSGHRITSDSAPGFVKMLLERGHESVIEHESLSVRFVCDRGVSHEIVRHRLASYSQESTRFCNYSKGRFGGEIEIIDLQPHCRSPKTAALWARAMIDAEDSYLSMIEAGEPPEIARSVLPNSLKTELVMTANLREWRHFFRLRTAEAAHPQMRELARPLLKELRRLIPAVFDDVGVVE